MGAFVSHYWQFGDGETSFEANPKHRYNMPGDYTVKYTATKESGLKTVSTFSQRVTDWSDVSNGLNVVYTDTCFKLALKPQQGVNLSECTGDDFVFTEGRAGTVKVKDSLGQFKQLAIDDKEKLWYHTSTRQGTINSGLTKVWKDKEGTDVDIDGITLSSGIVVSVEAEAHDLITGQTVKFEDVGGTTELNNNTYVVTVTDGDNFTLNGTDSDDFTAWTSGGTVTKQGTWPIPSFKRGEDRGEHEHFFLRDTETHLYARAENEENRDEAGYDSNGFPTGLEFTVKGYEGGSTTAKTTMTDVARGGEIISNINLYNNRIQYEVLANVSEIIVSGIQHYYEVVDITDDPDNINTDEIDYEKDIQDNLIVWISRSSSYLKNLATGTAISGTASQITGPDLKSKSAIRITTTLSLGNVSCGTLMLWHKAGYTISGVSLTQHNVIGSWILSYAIATIPANIQLVAGDLCDVRLYSDTKTAAMITYYYNNVLNNSGNLVMGSW